MLKVLSKINVKGRLKVYNNAVDLYAYVPFLSTIYPADSPSSNFILPYDTNQLLIAPGYSNSSFGTIFYGRNPAVPMVKINSSGSFLSNSYKTEGTMYTYLNDGVYNFVTQSDGSILTVSQGALSRTDIEGPGKIVGPFNATGDGYALAIQNNGKIVLGGTFTSYSGSNTNRIARANADFTNDNTFITGSGFDSFVYDIKIESSSQKIIVGGIFTQYSQSLVENHRSVTRINPDGTRDSDFKIGSGSNGQIYAVEIQPDGKILLGGTFTSFSGSSGINRIVRLMPSGNIDPDFKTNTGLNAGFNSTVYAIKVQPDGKILVGGVFNLYSGSTAQKFVRLDSSGAIDTTFKTSSSFQLSNLRTSNPNGGYIIRINLDSSNNIYCGGYFSNYSGSISNNIVKIKSDGTVDTSFISPSYTEFDYSPTQYRGAYAKPLSSGKILCLGDFTYYDTNPNPNIVYNAALLTYPSFSLDNSFTGYGLDLDGSSGVAPIKFVEQSDGKIVIAGNFSFYSGSNCKGLIRVNSDGTIDSTYKTGSGFNFSVTDLAIQSDGKVVAVGNFTSYSGSNTNRIVRINTDGSKDNTFITGSGFNSTPYSVAIQSDGKIIVGGIFKQYSGSVSSGSVRINTDGTKDPTFGSISGSSYSNPTNGCKQVIVQPDGKILLLGDFLGYQSASVSNSSRCAARINTDGSFDSSFNIGTGLIGSYFEIGVQAILSNRYVFGIYQANGSAFSATYNGTIISGSTIQYPGYFIFLDQSGNLISQNTLTGNINTSYTIFGFLNSMYELSDGKIIAAGSFYDCCGVPAVRLALLDPKTGGFAKASYY
jgi:uncharacterized delta-60 repeat protein